MLTVFLEFSHIFPVEQGQIVLCVLCTHPFENELQESCLELHSPDFCRTWCQRTWPGGHSTSAHAPASSAPRTGTWRWQSQTPWQPAFLPGQRFPRRCRPSESCWRHWHHHLQTTQAIKTTEAYYMVICFIPNSTEADQRVNEGSICRLLQCRRAKRTCRERDYRLTIVRVSVLFASKFFTCMSGSS